MLVNVIGFSFVFRRLSIQVVQFLLGTRRKIDKVIA